jgi:hypothetical protein
MLCSISRILTLRPRLKLEYLSIFICLLVLTPMYNCTEASADGIRKSEPCVEWRGVLSEAGEDYEESEMEVLEAMKVAKFDVLNNKVIDLKLHKLEYKCLI